MSDVSMKVDGDKLVITLDISKAARDKAEPSSTGKTKTLASTRGFTALSTPAGLVKVSLNASI